MASSYFTRPPGLHPTPSACFPPPPPPLKGGPTGTIIANPNTITLPANLDLEWNLCNNLLPIGDPCDTVWNLPAISDPNPDVIQNCTPASAGQGGEGPPGSYIGTAVVTWSNGQVRTYNIPYTILP